MSRLPTPAVESGTGAAAELFAQIKKTAGKTPNTLVVVALLALGSAGALAQENPYTKAPPPSPMSRVHQQALLNHDPDACAKAVEKASDVVDLRIQGKEGMDTRTTKNALLQAARNAAAAGDDAGCWHWFDKVSNFSK